MRRRRKVPKLAAVASPGKLEPFVSDPQLQDPDQNQMDRDPSVYLAVSRGYWFGSKVYYPLHKVKVEDAPSDGSSSPAAWKILRRVANLETDVGGKTFVSLQSRWIVGVGGNPGRTTIFDTKTARTIRGPKLVAAKWSPVVAAVGYKVYALSARPEYIDEPDFAPWFEVLDLSKAAVREAAAEGTASLSLERCSWKALPCPPFFPWKLTPADYKMPPVIAVRSYAVLGPYILVSLVEPCSDLYAIFQTNSEWQEVTYAYDTNSKKWHKVDGDHLPFIGAATPHGRGGCIFLALSRMDGPINAYRIRLSTCSSGVSENKGGGALKLSITVFSLRNKAHEEICARAWHCFASLDRGRFSTLTFSLDNRRRKMSYSDRAGHFYPTKLYAKLTTYQIESPALLEETPDEEKLLAVKEKHEIAISSQWDQAFKISSEHGFSSTPIAFTLSI